MYAVPLETSTFNVHALNGLWEQTSFYFFLRFKIVDDDVDWRQTVEEEKAVEEEEDEAPVVRTSKYSSLNQNAFPVPEYCTSQFL